MTSKDHILLNNTISSTLLNNLDSCTISSINQITNRNRDHLIEKVECNSIFEVGRFPNVRDLTVHTCNQVRTDIISFLLSTYPKIKRLTLIKKANENTREWGRDVCIGDHVGIENVLKLEYFNYNDIFIFENNILHIYNDRRLCMDGRCPNFEHISEKMRITFHCKTLEEAVDEHLYIEQIDGYVNSLYIDDETEFNFDERSEPLYKKLKSKDKYGCQITHVWPGKCAKHISCICDSLTEENDICYGCEECSCQTLDKHIQLLKSSDPDVRESAIEDIYDTHKIKGIDLFDLVVRNCNDETQSFEFVDHESDVTPKSLISILELKRTKLLDLLINVDLINIDMLLRDIHNFRDIIIQVVALHPERSKIVDNYMNKRFGNKDWHEYDVYDKLTLEEKLDISQSS